MKKLAITLFAAVVTLCGMAQEKSADQWKNEGNEAVRNKRYQEALNSYQQALKLWGDSTDAATVFNAAVCAMSLKQFDVANDYLTKSQSLGYKVEEAAYRKATILKNQKKTEEYHASLEEGFATYKNGKWAALFKKDLAKWYRDLAYASYNAGADITKKFAGAKPDQLEQLKADAKAKFQAATPDIDKALEINPDDGNAKQIKESIDKQLAAL